MSDLSVASLSIATAPAPGQPLPPCPGCGAGNCSAFYEARQVPTNSRLLLDSREEALRFPTGDVVLAHCPQCGFLFNAAFAPDRAFYSGRWEQARAHSKAFGVFSRRLAEELIQRHGLHGKRVLEIGCGNGEFLAQLCDLGGNEGIGYDPAFEPERLEADYPERITVVRDFFARQTTMPEADFVCCRMTLGQVVNVGNFVRMLRERLGARHDASVFFQTPNAARILDGGAFWDLCYEHCSYFTATALRSLFARSGFAVDRIWTDYGDQCLMIEAHPAEERVAAGAAPVSGTGGRGTDSARIGGFASASGASRRRWADLIARKRSDGMRIVLWGSGSRAATFLATLRIRDEIQYVVDIDPDRQDRYLPATGQRVVSPGFMENYRPDVVIVMNPIQRDEVARDLAERSLSAELLTL